MQESTIPDENDTLEERINAEWKREINDHEEEWMEEMNKEDIVIAEQTRKNDTDANYEKDQVQFNFNSILKKNWKCLYQTTSLNIQEWRISVW